MIALVLSWPVLAVAEVRMTRTPCYGRCPADAVQFTREEAHYSGYRHVTLIGHYHAKFSAAALEQQLRERGFDELPSKLGQWNIDAQTTTISVNAKTVVEDLSRFPELPPYVKMIEETIEIVPWEPVNSGLRGAIPYDFTVRGAGGEEFAPHSDRNGSYILPLKPGTYEILERKVVVHEREWVTVNAPIVR